ISVVDLAGQKRTLTKGWEEAAEIAWSPSGTEIWFACLESGTGRSIRAVSLDGKVRGISPGLHLSLHDIASDGRVLLEDEVARNGMYFGRAGDPVERDLSWLEGSGISNISADGLLLAFTEFREGGGANQTAYLRKTDGSVPVKLGEGSAMDLSRDGKWVLVGV